MMPEAIKPPLDRRRMRILNFVTCLHMLSLFSLSQLYIDIAGNSRHNIVAATSINYGIAQKPITDINQLMPKLCQNQSVICEGSFCIPGVRKCVCDLRMPVQFGKFCLRQLDINTKCFATSQCNHTIKEAVCIDTSSNAILDYESSKFKLDQWQHLEDLRKASQPTTNKDMLAKTIRALVNQDTIPRIYIQSGHRDSYSNLRNSPYEIKYDTPELLHQNHTRRKISSNNNEKNISDNDKFKDRSNYVDSVQENIEDARGGGQPTTEPVILSSTEASNSLDDASTYISSRSSDPTENPHNSAQLDEAIKPATSTIAVPLIVSTPSQQSSTTTTSLSTTQYAAKQTSEQPVRKKMVIKNMSWPPGVCSCPSGYMFDEMLRKCLALSLADSRCQQDTDCKQIAMTHCSSSTRKCECDEPLQWDSSKLACLRPKPNTAHTSPDVDDQQKDTMGLTENLLPTLILVKYFPDYTIMLMIFIILVIVISLFILRLTVKCFSSSSSSALISPKTKKKKSANANHTNHLSPKSPYATLRRPDHKPSSQLSSFTQTTRGRILNYDFEQEAPLAGTTANGRQNAAAASMTLHRNNKTLSGDRTLNAVDISGATLRPNKQHEHQHYDTNNIQNIRVHNKASSGQPIELNDNISIDQSEAEVKTDSGSLNIPAPPANQQPPYMLASSMKGQGSAIAAAAAAVANKRMQLAQKKNIDQQQQQQNSNILNANGKPVFL